MKPSVLSVAGVVRAARRVGSMAFALTLAFAPPIGAAGQAAARILSPAEAKAEATRATAGMTAGEPTDGTIDITLPGVGQMRVSPDGQVVVPDVNTLIPDIGTLPNGGSGGMMPDLTGIPNQGAIVPDGFPKGGHLDNKSQTQINNAKARAYFERAQGDTSKAKKSNCTTISIGGIGDGQAVNQDGVVVGNVSTVGSECR